MSEYLLLIVSFFATIIAIKGDTFNKKKKGLKKITFTGYLALILALASLLFNIIVTNKNNNSEQQKLDLLNKVSSEATEMKDSIQVLNISLNSSQRNVEKLQSKIDTYENILNKISAESERQPQWTFLNYYSIRPHQRISMPNKIYSGSILKFIGNGYGIVVRYNDKTVFVPNFDYKEPIEIPVFGKNGVGYSWDIECVYSPAEGLRSEFKIYILSTPRSRSNKWSYEEEAIK
jgi:hypothetical protein